MSEVGQKRNSESLLGYFGESAVLPLLGRMKSSNQEDRYAAADALVKISKTHPTAVKNLTDVFDDGSIKGIAANYPFYIRLGASGTEKLLLK
ncbi:MAG: HEAT repeat domain-containing protein, partial [bacterium]